MKRKSKRTQIPITAFEAHAWTVHIKQVPCGFGQIKRRSRLANPLPARQGCGTPLSVPPVTRVIRIAAPPSAPIGLVFQHHFSRTPVR